MLLSKLSHERVAGNPDVDDPSESKCSRQETNVAYVKLVKSSSHRNRIMPKLRRAQGLSSELRRVPFDHSLILNLVLVDSAIWSTQLRGQTNALLMIKVARGRFELPSAGDSYLGQADPEPNRDGQVSGPNVRAMLDHYTTGLRCARHVMLQ